MNVDLASVHSVSTAPTYTVAQIQAAENELFAHITDPDHLMRQAAHAVAVAARHMVETAHLNPRVLVLVGPGGNGGDGLYAAAELLCSGIECHVMAVQDRIHERAAASLRAAGGTVITFDPQDPTTQACMSRGYGLVIDAMFGIGGRSGLRGKPLQAWQQARKHTQAVLAVDVPSGVEADTGAFDPAAAVCADVSISFGGLRIAQALQPACGEIIWADIADERPQTLSSALAHNQPQVVVAQAIHRCYSQWPDPIHALPGLQYTGRIEPGIHDDKYTGGVVGVAAGSQRYPGAAVLATNAAVRATASMVRYVGVNSAQVLARSPEIVATELLADAGRVQAWVYGPGSDSDGTLAQLFATDTPLLIDAAGLRELAGDAQLRTELHARQAFTLLTPHFGEFCDLAQACGIDGDPAHDVRSVVLALSAQLQAMVLLKGRRTLIAVPTGEVAVIDAGNSFAATAGSGDILAGIIGAFMAQAQGTKTSIHAAIIQAVGIHGRAAALASGPVGRYPVHASSILESIPVAVATSAVDVSRTGHSVSEFCGSVQIGAPNLR
ncbi:MAG: NAD(P)H-hydrate epimerase [Corynebacterium sp.]|nr:NAD(P)H-hydrate epimerase [Corynebacterium sp.]